MENKTCAKCGSNHLVEGLPVYGGGSAFAVLGGGVQVASSAGFSAIVATVCGDCGFTEVYAKDPEWMWREWRKKNA